MGTIYKNQSSDIRSNNTSNDTSVYNLFLIVISGLIICILYKILGPGVFETCGKNGNIIGYIIHFVGAGIMYFTEYFSAPILFVAIILSQFQKKNKIRINGSVVYLIVIFFLYVFFHMAMASQFQRELRVEWIISSFPVAVMAIPLYNSKNIIFVLYGFVIAAISFVIFLVISGQLFSIISGAGVIGGMTEMSGRIELGTDTISSASLVYQCALACIVFILYGKQTNSQRQVLLIIVIILFICGVVTGSKGPLIAFIISVFIALWNKKINIYQLCFFIALISVLYLFISPILNVYSEAFIHLTDKDIGREGLYNIVIESMPKIMGNGLGSFMENNKIGSIYYVHNSVLEVYYEMGVIGIILFIIMVIKILRNLLKAAKNDIAAKFILSYFVYAFTFSMFSGTIFSDTELWFAISLACTNFEGSIKDINKHYD